MTRRHEKYGALDQEPLRDGDGFFLGVEMRKSPAQVEPGYVSLAKNARFDAEIPETRRGVGLLPWANQYYTSFPLVFPIEFGTLTGFGTVYGAGVFSDPASQEWIIFVTSSGVFITRDGFPLVELSLPAGVEIDGDVFLVQAFDKMLMFRGSEKSVLEWTRTFLEDPPWIEGWQEVTTSDLGDGRIQIPRATTATQYINRLFVPFDRDSVAYSDPLDYTRFVPVVNELRFQSGTADRLVRIYPFGRSVLIGFKSRSIFIAQNVKGTLDGIELDELTREFGLRGQFTVATVGNDIFFLSDTGVYSMRQVLDNRLQGTAEAVSKPIQPLIDRIHWRYADQAVAAYWNNKYYLAVPLDGSAQNNAVLIYDVLNKAWTGYDEGAAIKVKQFLKAGYRGRQRLFMIDYIGLVLVYEEHLAGDETTSGFVEIEFEILTRGYLCSNPDEKFFETVAVDLATHRPKYSISAEAQGVNA